MSNRTADVVHAWRNKNPLKFKNLNCHTDGNKLFSFDLVIGEFINNEPTVYLYLTQHGHYISHSTTRHVKAALRMRPKVKTKIPE